MKRFFSAVTVLGLGLLAVSVLADEKGASKGGADLELKDLRQQVSYSLGLSMGRNMKSQSIDLDPDLVARGIRDGMGGGRPLMTDQQIQQAMQAFQRQMANRQAGGASKAVAEKNQKEGDAFLAANKKKQGVTTLPSGLQYRVIKDGAGPSPKATDTVTTHYKGTLIDGTEFDSSYKHGGPASFPVNGVIPGWTEALQRMKVGSHWQLFVPAELAYGANPRPGGPIGPNATLIFEVELLGIK
jgi:FKBP-type peptidyl-prolyl cis-trans isomerase FklB